MDIEQNDRPREYSLKIIFLFIVGALLLVALGIALQKYKVDSSQGEVERSNLDKVTAVVRENRNRLEVTTLTGKITTVRETSGGIFGMFDGKLVIRQPFSVGYFVDMGRMGLSDYIWDEKTKTLFVRLPDVTADPPNIDATRQEVAVKGWVITRDMQERLRQSVARGAAQQARDEAGKSEHMNAARTAAKAAITRNLSVPLRKAGVGDVRIEVLDPKALSGEHWDVSRSIAEVLAELAASRN